MVNLMDHKTDDKTNGLQVWDFWCLSGYISAGLRQSRLRGDDPGSRYREKNYLIKVNADFGSLQIGHLQVDGRSSKDVPGGMFWVGSPLSG